MKSLALRLVAVALAVGLPVCAVSAAAQEPPPESTAPPTNIGNEYRLTAYPYWPFTDKLTGIGYLGYVTKPDADYDSLYLATIVSYRAHEAVQLWGGLIGVWTDQDESGKSNTLELRPFTGVKFMGANQKKWRYYNWTRYEIRLTETRDTDEWTTVHRVRNQTRIDFPLAPLERAWTPKTFFVWTDIEPIWRSDTGRIDPLRWRTGIGYIANPGLLIEFQYYAQYTQPDAGLQYTDNIWRLNIKFATRRGLRPHIALRNLLDSNVDD